MTARIDREYKRTDDEARALIIDGDYDELDKYTSIRNSVGSLKTQEEKNREYSESIQKSLQNNAIGADSSDNRSDIRKANKPTPNDSNGRQKKDSQRMRSFRNHYAKFANSTGSSKKHPSRLKEITKNMMSNRERRDVIPPSAQQDESKTVLYGLSGVLPKKENKLRYRTPASDSIPDKQAFSVSYTSTDDNAPKPKGFWAILTNNIQWIFSGIGVYTILLIIRFRYRKIDLL